MPVPHVASAFGDLVDRRVTKIFWDTYDQLPSRIGDLYAMQSSSDQYETYSQVGALPNYDEFTGSVAYKAQNQGYDTRFTHLEFASGVQIERELFDDDRHGVWERRPSALAMAANRTRETHGARVLNMAFSVDTYFSNNTEAVAVCSNSHTTTSGAGTGSGFDNLTTASLSAVSVAAARIQHVGLRGDQAERISLMPNELWVPPDLYDIAYEIADSQGKPDTANNNANVHFGKYTVKEWNYMTDTNNWFLMDSGMRKQSLFWFERIPLEFAFAEELDTILAKWRSYMRYSLGHSDWRFVLGAQVS